MGGGTQYGVPPVNAPIGGQSLLIMPASSRQFAEQYPLAPNVTMVFINYNQRKLWIKTQSANGLGYGIEDFNLVSDEALQQYLQPQEASQIQNGFVTQQEFSALTTAVSELRSQIDELLK